MQRSTDGLTIVELLVALALFGVLMTAIGALLFGLGRYYAGQTARAAARQALRGAAQVLAAEVRELSPDGGDLYALAPDSLALRSTQGIGSVCRAVGARLWVWRIAGVFASGTHDSVLVFAGADRASDPAADWTSARVVRAEPSSLGACSAGLRPERALLLSRAVPGVTVGSPVRAFRPYVYRFYRGAGGEWWLGQRTRGADLQPVAGPFARPGPDGAFDYRGIDDRAAARAAEVARIGFLIRATREGPGGSRGNGRRVDSLSTVVRVRNGPGVRADGRAGDREGREGP